MPISPGPVVPNIVERPATFEAEAEAWTDWIAGEHRTQINALETNVNAREVAASASAAAALASANAAQSDRALTQTAAYSPAVQGAAANAAAAQAAAAAAAASAAIAQAVSPDSPVRMNTRLIVQALTIPAAYNAASVGPITLTDGITVTVQDHATWSIT